MTESSATSTSTALSSSDQADDSIIGDVNVNGVNINYTTEKAIGSTSSWGGTSAVHIKKGASHISEGQEFDHDYRLGITVRRST